MSIQHKDLVPSRWQQMPLIEQMANIGSEVERAISWRTKGRGEYSRLAFERALELIDLTLPGVKGFCRLRELTRLREVLVDHFFGQNEYGTSEVSLKKYFQQFAYAARRHM